MKRCSLLLIVAVIVVQPAVAAEPKQQPQSAVFIDFPIGDLHLQYVESAQGMILDVYMDGKSTCVRARRVYLGDGKHAVKFEATNHGVMMGKQRATQLDYDNGATLEYDKRTASRWGSKPGELYLLIPNLKLRPSD